MTWLAVRLRPRSEERDAAVAALIDLGSGGVQDEGDSLFTCFPETLGETTLRDSLARLAPGVPLEIFGIPETDWLARWRTSVLAQELGAIAIVPPWLAEGRDPDRTVAIEPGMAFGTGDHASTRGAIRLLQSTIRRGDRVADLGAGSAVLAIAAAKLGARRVAAIELDPDAIDNAEGNVRANLVGDRVTVIEGDAATLLPLLAPLDLVVANIISSVILELLPAISDAVVADGRAIFAGLLSRERAVMLDPLRGSGWRVSREDFEGEWWSLGVQRG